jgi:hypothetical protein
MPLTQEWLAELRDEFRQWREQHGDTRPQALAEIVESGEEAVLPVDPADPWGAWTVVSLEEAATMLSVYEMSGPHVQEGWARDTIPKCIEKSSNLWRRLAGAMQDEAGGEARN